MSADFLPPSIPNEYSFSVDDYRANGECLSLLRQSSNPDPRVTVYSHHRSQFRFVRTGLMVLLVATAMLFVVFTLSPHLTSSILTLSVTSVAGAAEQHKHPVAGDGKAKSQKKEKDEDKDEDEEQEDQDEEEDDDAEFLGGNNSTDEDLPAPAPQGFVNPFGAFASWAGSVLGTVSGMLAHVALDLHIASTTTTSTVTVTVSTTTTTSTWTTTSTTITTTSTKLCTLFCWAVVRVDGYEPPLVEKQFWNRASIFACEDYDVYSTGGVTTVGSIQTIAIPAPRVSMGNLSKAGTTTTSWLNTLTFMKAWEMILAKNTWWQHEWIVKVDPDAVFFPHRLKVELYDYYRAGDVNGPAMFVGNCDRTWNGQPWSLKLFGSFEVFSRNALGVYKTNGQRCKDELDWKGWGEDFFMQMCMEKLQVQKINGVEMLADNRCYAAPCSDPTKVTYHDFKSVDSWLSCWGTSKAAEDMRMKRLKKLRK